MTVKQNWLKVKQQVNLACQRSGRDPKQIQVIAVTKYVGTPDIEEVLQSGLEHIGENKAQDALKKWEWLQGRGTWHFIGHLQSNKVKDIIGKFSYIHSLDRFSLAKEINRRSAEKQQISSCFVQVNVSGEKSKHGISPNEAADFISDLAAYPWIKVVGLMTMAPWVAQSEETRPVFAQLREIQCQLQAKKWSHAPLAELSMGMSNDYEIAVEEGATYLRLGSCLVGKDPV